VYHAALIREDRIRPDERVAGDRLPEDLDAEGVGDDVLRLAVDVRVHERDVVVAGDDVAEGREPLFDAPHLDGVREGVAEVLQLLVGRRRRNEQAGGGAGARKLARRMACCVLKGSETLTRSCFQQLLSPQICTLLCCSALQVCDLRAQLQKRSRSFGFPRA
jgi:hypothetical protein